MSNRAINIGRLVLVVVLGGVIFCGGVWTGRTSGTTRKCSTLLFNENENSLFLAYGVYENIENNDVFAARVHIRSVIRGYLDVRARLLTENRDLAVVEKENVRTQKMVNAILQQEQAGAFHNLDVSLGK